MYSINFCMYVCISHFHCIVLNFTSYMCVFNRSRRIFEFTLQTCSSCRPIYNHQVTNPHVLATSQNMGSGKDWEIQHLSILLLSKNHCIANVFIQNVKIVEFVNVSLPNVQVEHFHISSFSRAMAIIIVFHCITQLCTTHQAIVVQYVLFCSFDLPKQCTTCN